MPPAQRAAPPISRARTRLAGRLPRPPDARGEGHGWGRRARPAVRAAGSPAWPAAHNDAQDAPERPTPASSRRWRPWKRPSSAWTGSSPVEAPAIRDSSKPTTESRSDRATMPTLPVPSRPVESSRRPRRLVPTSSGRLPRPGAVIETTPYPTGSRTYVRVGAGRNRQGRQVADGRCGPHQRRLKRPEKADGRPAWRSPLP